MDRKTRTYFLVMFAVLMGVVGYVVALPATWEGQIPDNFPWQPPEQPLQVVSTIAGLSANQLGWPGQFVVTEDRLFVVDRLASEDLIKVFSLTGEFMHGFGDVKKGEITRVLDIALAPSSHIIVLDEAPAILVFAQTGALISRLELAHFDPRFALNWAISIMPADDGYYLLTLDRLVHLDRRGRVIATYAGRPEGLYLGAAPSEFRLGPTGILLQDGRVWIADSVHGRVLRVGEDGEFDLALPLPIVNDVTPYPTSLAAGPEGSLLVVDSARQMLLALSTEGEVLWELRLSAVVDQQGLDMADVAMRADGTIYISNFLTGQVERFTMTNGRLSMRQAVLTPQANFLFPRDLASMEDALYILSESAGSSGGAIIYRHDLATGAGRRHIASGLTGAKRLAANNGTLYVLTERVVLAFNKAGEQVLTIGEAGEAFGGFGVVNLFGENQGPQGLDVDSLGQVWVSDTFKHRLLVFTAKGDFLREIALDQEVWPAGLAFLPDGNMLVLNSLMGQVVHIDSSGLQIAVYGAQGKRWGQLGVVEEMGFLGRATDIWAEAGGSFFVVDTVNNRVQKFSPQGAPVLVQGNFGGSLGALNLPQALVPTSVPGEFFLADTNNHRLKLVQFP